LPALAAAALCAAAAWPAGAAAGPGGRRSHEAGGAAARIAVHLTREGARTGLQALAPLRWRAGAGRGDELVRVQPARRLQALTAGFGVAMTDTSAWVIRRKLPPRLRDRVMRRLFSRRGGIGLSYLRVPMGASDYVVGRPYTYDDMPPGQRDPALRRFSLRHDRAYVFPAIRQALRLNPRMTVMANPWTPPAWMKTDDSLIPTGPGPASSLREDAYGPYARYLVQVIEGYRGAGVRVDQLGVVNEPLNTKLTQSFPQTWLAAEGEATLIRRHLAPALRRAKLRPRLLAYDYIYARGAGDEGAYVPTVMAGAGRFVDGLAFHCYLSDPRIGSAYHRLYPHKPQFETECSSYLSQLEPAQMSIRVLRNWAQGVQLWNAALDQDLGPKVGQGCRGIVGPHAGEECIAPVIVDTARGRYRLTSDYWALGQFSAFIHLGARRVASTATSDCNPLPQECGLENVAFRNPDGTRVVVATAGDGRPHRLRLVEGNRHAVATVPDGAVVTYTWRP
jgi:glucosylceramidase